jgi:hypothetical protein
MIQLSGFELPSQPVQVVASHLPSPGIVLDPPHQQQQVKNEWRLCKAAFTRAAKKRDRFFWRPHNLSWPPVQFLHLSV